MVAYSFQPQFVHAIRCGLSPLGLGGPMSVSGVRMKRQTIRAIGAKRHAMPGDALQLYCQQRGPSGFKIGDAQCTRVRPIRLRFGKTDTVTLDVASLMGKAPSLDGFARLDGFHSWEELRRFWAKHHPGVTDFRGLLIEWEPL